MAAPVLGGILVADEVIDLFLPVLYWVHAAGAGSVCTRGQGRSNPSKADRPKESRI